MTAVQTNQYFCAGLGYLCNRIKMLGLKLETRGRLIFNDINRQYDVKNDVDGGWKKM
jgi:hypothetical protein